MAPEIVKDINSYFTFRIGGERFAVNVGHVIKIVEMVPITRIPNSPRHFKGIINLVGEVLPVFDGRLKLGFPEGEITRNTCILVLVFGLEGEVAVAGMIIDSVEKVITLGTNQLQSAQEGANGFDSEFIGKIASVDDEFIAVLNIEKIFSDEEIHIIRSV